MRTHERSLPLAMALTALVLAMAGATLTARAQATASAGSPSSGATGATAAAEASPMPTALAVREPVSGGYVADGVVEPVRKVLVAAQVAGRITRLEARAGDRVVRGQVIARIDERSAVQQASASSAQVAAAQAALEAARRELERSERLHRKEYISQAAMDRARAQYDAAAAQARATIAQAGAASTQTSLHTVVAPFDGIVSRAMVEQGDMAMPDKPLLELYDPGALRVTAYLPEAAAARLQRGAPVSIIATAETDARARTASSYVVMPTADPATHSFEIRVPLDASSGASLAPGQFVRVTLPLVPASGAQATGSRLTVPASAVVRRTEFAGVYVIGPETRPQLRQVRLGRVIGDRVEVLAGLAEGERVALSPARAAQAAGGGRK